jgi:hypothetical protein
VRILSALVFFQLQLELTNRPRGYLIVRRDRLHEEVKDLIDYLEPSEEEHIARKLVIQRASSCIRQVFENASVCVFGSFNTKLYLPSRFVAHPKFLRP